MFCLYRFGTFRKSVFYYMQVITMYHYNKFVVKVLDHKLHVLLYVYLIKLT